MKKNRLLLDSDEEIDGPKENEEKIEKKVK